MYVDNEWATPYVWHDGKIVKRSELRSAAADSAASVRVWSDWRVIVLLVLVGLTMLIIAASWIIRRRKMLAQQPVTT